MSDNDSKPDFEGPNVERLSDEFIEMNDFVGGDRIVRITHRVREEDEHFILEPNEEVVGFDTHADGCIVWVAVTDAEVPSDDAGDE